MFPMKNLLFLLFFAPMAALASQGTNNPSLDAITKAIGSGDIELLSKYFDEHLEVSIMDNEKNYSKSEATEVVKTFFGSNKPISFNPLHNGTSRESSDKYCIGNLTASSGNYRVYIYLKVTGANLTIKELRFDKE
jgi:hypothetical protein